MREPTLGEMQIKFESHEQRDVDRFDATTVQMKEGFNDIIQKLDEIKDTLSSRVDDHEQRLRIIQSDVTVLKTRLVTYGALLTIVLGVVEFAAQIYFR